VVIDPTAKRKKYLLVGAIREWNATHPKQHVSYAPGFDPDTEKIGTPARETLRAYSRTAWHDTTGVWNADTMRRLILVRNPRAGIRAEVMALAHSQLGVHETPDGSNWGPVAKYLEAVGIHGGAPWCASFVTWALKKCGLRAYPPNPAYVPSWEDWGRQHGLLIPVKDSKLGDLWVWNWDGGLADHIGFCDDSNPGDPVAYYLDGNIGNRVTQGSRPAAGIEVAISLAKLAALR